MRHWLHLSTSHELETSEDIILGSKLRVDSLVSTAGSCATSFSGASFEDDEDDDTASCGTPVYRMPSPEFESDDGDETEMHKHSTAGACEAFRCDDLDVRPKRSRRVSFDAPEEEEKVVIGRRPRSVSVHDLESLVFPSDA